MKKTINFLYIWILGKKNKRKEVEIFIKNELCFKN